jgi:hypothetical protein
MHMGLVAITLALRLALGFIFLIVAIALFAPAVYGLIQAIKTNRAEYLALSPEKREKEREGMKVAAVVVVGLPMTIIVMLATHGTARTIAVIGVFAFLGLTVTLAALRPIVFALKHRRSIRRNR